ncbi:S-adenosyl-L-methionine-dependent methyltransferase [Aspergillus californicus]
MSQLTEITKQGSIGLAELADVDRPLYTLLLIYLSQTSTIRFLRSARYISTNSTAFLQPEFHTDEMDSRLPLTNGSGCVQYQKASVPSYQAERTIDTSALSREAICGIACGNQQRSGRRQNIFHRHGDGLALILLSTRQYNTYKSSFTGVLNVLSDLESSAPTADILCRLAHELDNRSLRNILPEKASIIEKELASTTHSNSLLLATLAAEILTYQGTLTLPMKTIMELQQRAGGSVDLNEYTRHAAATFEKRIKVDDYNFFELVHPAYFHQTVALANLVTRFIKNPRPRAIDVGPGPGTNLLAFLELFPQTDILAIKPSDIAFQYLPDHFKGEIYITWMREDFLCVPVESEEVDYIMSTGASHYFHTDGFLQRSAQWLRPGGYWFIADEMISPFETRKERHLNLLRHHLAYMAPLCFSWPARGVDPRTLSEREFVTISITPFRKPSFLRILATLTSCQE